ncbi:MAG: 3-methyl-2-oxobutanoate hydroxymethyltransferase [Candidatus Schekmanbacteria bacterium]|nr:3-methyl-2-oxobutanoate hydroxymethyltransferase [Candidatus Schekmanbacteria bacterium]
MAGRKVTIPDLVKKKQDGQKITMLTAYDCPTAKVLDEAEIDIVLVGDSLGMVVLGYENTLPVTMDEMLHHTKAVRRGLKRSLLVGDMPFMSYQLGVPEALYNAGRFLKEGGAEAVKLEGAGTRILEITRAMVEIGIPVMGHLGLTPQFVHQMGGYRVQGRNEEAAKLIVDQAQNLEAAGVFALVLEGVPPNLAKVITPQLKIPTLGIGAGPDCDGQVLVSLDLLGMSGAQSPKFVKRYANLREESLKAVRQFKQEVESQQFPTQEYCY